jgi:hypothetical protein
MPHWFPLRRFITQSLKIPHKLSFPNVAKMMGTSQFDYQPSTVASLGQSDLLAAVDFLEMIQEESGQGPRLDTHLQEVVESALSGVRRNLTNLSLPDLQSMESIARHRKDPTTWTKINQKAYKMLLPQTYSPVEVTYIIDLLGLGREMKMDSDKLKSLQLTNAKDMQGFYEANRHQMNLLERAIFCERYSRHKSGERDWLDAQLGDLIDSGTLMDSKSYIVILSAILNTLRPVSEDDNEIADLSQPEFALIHRLNEIAIDTTDIPDAPYLRLMLRSIRNLKHHAIELPNDRIAGNLSKIIFHMFVTETIAADEAIRWITPLTETNMELSLHQVMLLLQKYQEEADDRDRMSNMGIILSIFVNNTMTVWRRGNYIRINPDVITFVKKLIAEDFEIYCQRVVVAEGAPALDDMKAAGDSSLLFGDYILRLVDMIEGQLKGAEGPKEDDSDSEFEMRRPRNRNQKFQRKEQGHSKKERRETQEDEDEDDD